MSIVGGLPMRGRLHSSIDAAAPGGRRRQHAEPKQDLYRRFRFGERSLQTRSSRVTQARGYVGLDARCAEDLSLWERRFARAHVTWWTRLPALLTLLWVVGARGSADSTISVIQKRAFVCATVGATPLAICSSRRSCDS